MTFSKYAHIASQKRNAECTRIFEILLLCSKQAFRNVSARIFLAYIWMCIAHVYVHMAVHIVHCTLYTLFPDLIKQKISIEYVANWWSHVSFVVLSTSSKHGKVYFIWMKRCYIWTSIVLTQIIKWTQSILWSHGGNWQAIANFHIALESFQYSVTSLPYFYSIEWIDFFWFWSFLIHVYSVNSSHSINPWMKWGDFECQYEKLQLANM